MNRRQFISGSVASLGYLLLPQQVLAKSSFPDIELISNSNSFSVRQLFGQPILFNFWTTMCNPCIEEIPELCQINKEIIPVVGLISLSTDDFRSQRYQNWVQKLNISYPNFAFDPNKYESLSRTLFNQQGAFPAFALVDSEGYNLWSSVGKITNSDVRKIKSLI